MIQAQIKGAVDRFVQVLRELAPKDTGNLAYNAIRVESVGVGRWRIYVNMTGEHRSRALDGIAPYQKYVNDSPTLSNGQSNKNYHWWEKAVELAAEELAKALKGSIDHD
ncbi:MAG: hypothetical protein E7663_04740 [Ruminococcaceae bacterium]|nr:hypothetical protein [Oscillospiraceae bacterium]